MVITVYNGNNYFYLNKIIKKNISRYKVIGTSIVNSISGVGRTGFVYLIIVSRQLNLMQTLSSYIKGKIQKKVIVNHSI